MPANLPAAACATAEVYLSVSGDGRPPSKPACPGPAMTLLNSVHPGPGCGSAQRGHAGLTMALQGLQPALRAQERWCTACRLRGPARLQQRQSRPEAPAERKAAWRKPAASHAATERCRHLMGGCQRGRPENCTQGQRAGAGQWTAHCSEALALAEALAHRRLSVTPRRGQRPPPCLVVRIWCIAARTGASGESPPLG